MRSAVLLPMVAGLAACSDGGDTRDAGDTLDAAMHPDGSTDLDGGLSDAGTGNIDFDRLTDAFDGDALDQKWSIHRPEVASIRVGSGQLTIDMTQEALWFEDRESVLVHQSVTGDFAVEAAVHTESISSPGSPPSRTVHLGGIMARNGNTDAENYVFVVVGFDENDLSVETKSTVGGASQYVGPSWASGEAELRICRRGSEFRLFKRPIGATTWELADTLIRDDLPPTLQVGPIAYAFGQPDLRVRFDYVVFSAPCP